MLLLLAACAPYANYWDGEGPSLSSATIEGEQLVLSGAGLGTASTVVVGGLNARVVEAAEGSVTATLPWGLPPGPLAVSVVTDDGQSTLEEALTWRAAAGDEAASAVLAQVDCPIETRISLEDGDFDLLFWCGMEMGYADAWGLAGPGAQPGFAAELVGYGSLLGAPELDSWRLYLPGEPRQPKLPQKYGGNAPDETWAIETTRDFTRDLASLQDQLALIEALYYWIVEDTSAPQAWFYDEDSCYDSAAEVGQGSTVSSLDVSAPAGALGLWLGAEVYEEGNYTYELANGTAELAADGSGYPSGAVLGYDEYSGNFLAYAVGGFVGRSDLPPDAEYSVTTTRFGEITERGSLQAPGPFVVTVPGAEDPEDPGPQWRSLLDEHDVLDVFLSEDLTVKWSGGESGDLVVVELAVYDADIDDPGWMTELYRISGLVDAGAGEAIVPQALLEQLPSAPNAVDANYDLTGYWAEVTVTRHHLSALDLDEGQLVVDMAYAVNAPIGLSSTR